MQWDERDMWPRRSRKASFGAFFAGVYLAAIGISLALIIVRWH